LFSYSQQFDGNDWSKTNISVSANTGDTTAPDGSSTAEKVSVVDIGSNAYRLQRNITAPANNIVSFFAKAGTNNYVQVSYANGDTTSYVNFDITAGAGAVGTTAGTATGSIVDAGNGWYRCIAINTAAVGTIYISMAPNASSGRGVSFDPTGTENYYIWGAQLEQRSSVTAYTATTTRPITNYIPVLQTAASGVARFEHNPVTGESLGLEIEEQRTNLLTYSEQFDDAAWTKAATTVEANTVISPDGTLTGDKLVEDTASTQHEVVYSITPAAATYTLSFYAKAGGRNNVQVSNTLVGTQFINFDLANGQVGNSAAYTGTITNVGNGWYRCTATVASAGGAFGQRIGLITSSTAVRRESYTGDGFSGIYLWGAQLEAGSFPTSYIPTVDSQVTRSADNASMTGTNFSSWYRADQGTFFTDYVSAAGNSSQTAFSALGTSGNSISLVVDNSASTGAGADITRIRIQTNGADQSTTNLANPLSRSTAYKAAIAYAVNDIAGSLNAGTVATDTSALLPVVDSLNIGTSSLNSTMKKLAYYPLRLTNSEIQSLTTI
jgi:hypothetical protein